MRDICHIVGPHFKSDVIVRVKGIRGKGTIVGATYRSIVIEYTQFKVRIGDRVHTVAPADIREAETRPTNPKLDTSA